MDEDWGGGFNFCLLLLNLFIFVRWGVFPFVLFLFTFSSRRWGGFSVLSLLLNLFTCSVLIPDPWSLIIGHPRSFENCWFRWQWLLNMGLQTTRSNDYPDADDDDGGDSNDDDEDDDDMHLGVWSTHWEAFGRHLGREPLGGASQVVLHHHQHHHQHRHQQRHQHHHHHYYDQFTTVRQERFAEMFGSENTSKLIPSATQVRHYSLYSL